MEFMIDALVKTFVPPGLETRLSRLVETRLMVWFSAYGTMKMVRNGYECKYSRGTKSTLIGIRENMTETDRRYIPILYFIM